MERFIKIGKANLRYNLYPHILLSILLLCVSPFVLGVENLDPVRTAQVLEMYVALLGMLLLTPLFLPEQNKEIKDLVESKYTPATFVYLIRVVEAVICLAILIGIYIMILKNNNCTFPEMRFYLGTLAEALFLGGMGLCSYSFFNQIAIAYMLPMVYYILSFGSGKKILGNFYLFSMAYGGYREKWYLAIAGFFFVVLGLSYQYFSKKLFIRN
jgi:hypothetical protein